ncbi:hypothetical protein [Mesorhizobium escarrei]|uniref:Uncharacterized protein n=1 Tax=Mesorhizobium escarrei TaxID=666018 RepID=A0ABN8JZS3_9HYPH|nr:hypothetical protein [Mesorhizobium escarrei]CAH2402382.1 hypothetical protein MES5069_310118 [Mesorhizobium escarrei]
MALSPSLRTAAAFGVLILVIAILIAGLLTGFSLDEKQASFWDVVLKAVGGIIALAGAGGAVYKYFEEKAKETDEKAKANRAAKSRQTSHSLRSASRSIGSYATRPPLSGTTTLIHSYAKKELNSSGFSIGAACRWS